MSQTITVPAQLAQGIHEYLMTRPMREVEGLVAGLRQCAPPPEAGNTASDRKAEKAA